MDAEAKPTKSTANEGAPATAESTADLSAAIDGTIERQPGEQVRCVRVFGDRYRCNWWVRDKLVGPVYLNAGRIVRSKFLRVTCTGDQLIIQESSICE